MGLQSHTCLFVHPLLHLIQHHENLVGRGPRSCGDVIGVSCIHLDGTFDEARKPGSMNEFSSGLSIGIDEGQRGAGRMVRLSRTLEYPKRLLAFGQVLHVAWLQFEGCFQDREFIQTASTV